MHSDICIIVMVNQDKCARQMANISACADLEGRAVERERASLHGDLLQLSQCKWSGSVLLLHQLCQIVTPLKVEAWAEALSSHPNQAFVKYLVDGICWGFHSGYGGGNPHQKRQPAHSQPAPE